MSCLKVLTAGERDQLVNIRDGEAKLGESVLLLDPANWQQSLAASPALFVLLGIPEDIGVRANYGIGGTYTLWPAALKAILNVQETDVLTGSRIAALGAFDFTGWLTWSSGMDIDHLREAVSQIDDEVFPVVRDIISIGKIPIVIGGGHNNSYPLISAASSALGTQINCINLDAHSDYRPMEGRHSGNGFRYAKAEGYLKKYAVVGLHQSYNSQSVLRDLTADPDIQFSFYEDMLLSDQTDFDMAVDDAILFTFGAPTGIELDLDAIEGVLTSAATPSGLSSLQARRYIHKCARNSTPAYLHIPEGSTRLSDGREDPGTGKLVAYLVTDFIRAHLGK